MAIRRCLSNCTTKRARFGPALNDSALTAHANHRGLHDHWMEGKTFGEIVATLNCTAKQARDRHARMVDRLRVLLSRPAGTPEPSAPPRSLRDD